MSGRDKVGGRGGDALLSRRQGQEGTLTKFFIELFRILRVERILEVSIRLVTGLFYYDVGGITRDMKRHKGPLEVLAIDD